MTGMVKLIVRTPRLMGAFEAADLCMLLEHTVLFLEVTDEGGELCNAYLRYGDESLFRDASDVTRTSVWPHLRFLKALRKLNYTGEVRGLMPRAQAEVDYELGLKVASLTLRFRVSGKIEADEWFGVLGQLSRSVEVKETDYSIRDAIGGGSVLLVTTPMRYFTLLREGNMRFEEVRYAGFPVVYPPLVRMVRLYRKGRLTEDELRRAVHEHSKFYDLLMKSSDIDEAVERWTLKELGRWVANRQQDLAR
ncbi:MAG: hypothetical protein NZ957_04720 [Thaumarchaeota archaeon]|nr:hypothetical protein [Candidatus Calditenuaceae archaeon]MDW8041406.1 hypothetical protein [Nitrososphaerota archaeon]